VVQDLTSFPSTHTIFVFSVKPCIAPNIKAINPVIIISYD
ncbi:unnamed protein product, partial [marine sediment metagenome]